MTYIVNLSRCHCYRKQYRNKHRYSLWNQ